MSYFSVLFLFYDGWCDITLLMYCTTINLKNLSWTWSLSLRLRSPAVPAALVQRQAFCSPTLALWLWGPDTKMSDAGAPLWLAGQTQARFRPLQSTGGARQGVSLWFIAGSQSVVLLQAALRLCLQSGAHQHQNICTKTNMLIIIEGTGESLITS